MREYDAESPKQGRKRLNSIVKTIGFGHLVIILYLWWILLPVKATVTYSIMDLKQGKSASTRVKDPCFFTWIRIWSRILILMDQDIGSGALNLF